MNKLLTKIAGVALGLTMAIGVGVAVGASRSEAVPVHAAAGGNPSSGTTWEPISSASDINTTSDFLLGYKYSGTDYFVSGDVSSSALNTTSTLTSATFVRFENYSGDYGTGYNIKITSTKYLAYGSSSTNLSSGTSISSAKYVWTTGTNSGTTYLYVSNNNRFLGAASASASAKVRAYATSNLGSYPIVQVYKQAASKTLSSIAVTTPPTKTTYYVGDSFDSTGMVVTASYSSGSPVAVTDKCTFSPATFTSTGDQNITVSYTEGGVTKTATQAVTVNAARTLESVYINGSLEKSSYYTTDSEWDLTGLELWGDYNEGDDEKLGNVVDLIDAGDMILSIDPETPTDAATSTTSIRLYDILYGDEMVDGVEKTISVTVSVRPFADSITYAKTASVRGNTTSAWGTPGSVTDFTGASYYIYSMGVSSTDKAVRWNANGYLYSTVAPTNAKVKSVEIASISTGKSINVYGSNTAYSSVPLSGNVSSLNENTLTYTFEDDYKYIALKGTDSSTEVGTITITYELLEPKLTLGASTLEMSTSSTDNTITVVTENFDSGTIGYSYTVSGDDVLESYSVSAGKLSITSKSATGTATLTVTATLGAQIANASIDVTVAESRNLTGLAITPNTGNREFEQYATLTAGNLEVVASFDAEPTSQSFTDITSEDTKGLTFSPALGSELSTSGSVVITVSYTYRGVTKSAQYTITVNAYVAHTWTKVTTAPADWRGTYLLGYEKEGTFYAFNSSLATFDATFNTVNTTSVSSGVVTGSKALDDVAVKIERNTVSGTSYYHALCANGEYLKSASKSINHQKTATEADAVTFDGVSLKIGDYWLRFNTANDQLRFRFGDSSYLSSTTASLYKMNVTSAISTEVSNFVSGFDTAFGSTVCKTDGTTNVSTVNSNWTAQAKEFAKLSVDAQGILANTTYTHDAETSGSTADIVDRYDYIYGKYSASLTKGDFMNRSDAGTLVAYSARVNPLNVGENGNTTAIIVVISLVSVTALGGYFFIKKKKEQ